MDIHLKDDRRATVRPVRGGYDIYLDIDGEAVLCGHLSRGGGGRWTITHPGFPEAQGYGKDPFRVIADWVADEVFVRTGRSVR
jgi:hypothetical protein